MAIEAVVFDIGNVLIEWRPERWFAKKVGTARQQAFFAEVDLQAMTLRVDLGEGLASVIGQTITAHPDFRTELTLWRDRWIELAAPPIPRSLRLMEALQRNGLPVFALTNFGADTWDIARPVYPFLDRFDRAFVSGRMRLLKPDPEIYRAVEAESGIAPERLIFTDDRSENVEAAALRGWHTHLFEGPEGLAGRLVAEGLLNEMEAA